jgi:hypothetical protein
MEFLEARNLLATFAFNDTFVYLKTPQLPPNHLPVLQNDQAHRPRIVAVGEADQGGLVRIIDQGRLLSYRPQADFEGTETFGYSIRTPDGALDSAEVQILVTRPAIVSGTSWLDHNKDGERQGGEPGIRDWTIYLDMNKNDQLDSKEPAHRTGPQGEFRFVVPPGDYRVAEIHPPGWTQTVPSTRTYDVSLQAGDVVEDLDFANHRSRGSLHGFVWADRNGDGQRQVQEHGVPGWPVYLDTNDNGSHDEGERLVQTDLAGFYGFVVEEGQYNVVQGTRRGWEPTAPENSSYTVDVDAGEHVNGLVFGNQPQSASLHGSVWADRNGDGERQTRERGLPGWPVYLDTNNNGSHEEGERLVHTNSDGYYGFVVEAGEYNVAQGTRRGWDQTVPENSSYTVELEPGQHVDGLVFGNQPQSASLHGVVWADRNGDGERQAIERGVPGWPVYLDTNNNGSHDQGERLVHTNPDGHYGFVVEAGQYNVVQGTRPGWDQTAPENSSYTVELEPGDHVDGLVFGNQPQFASLHGFVWADRNGDGERQEQEHGVPAWPVYLDTNNNGSHDEGERLVRTDSRGHYELVVEAGQYTVAQGNRPGWQQTAPKNGSYSVDVDPGEHLGGLAFGNQPQAGSLHGTVWADRNGNGQRETIVCLGTSCPDPEPGLEGWPVYLDANNNGSHDQGERLVHTDQHGHYGFVVEAGEYTVAQGTRPGWLQTAPDNSSYTVELEPGEHVNGLVFGNQPQSASLHGVVWADRNGDGERQAQEHGVPGWPVYLDTNNNGSHDQGERLVHTDQHGHYGFVVEAGQYTVAQGTRRGWDQTAPENSSYTVELEPGDHVDGLVFGNQPQFASLHGFVWADRNGDGERQVQEHGVPGWPVYLDTNNNGSHDQGERLVHTDVAGFYGFVVDAGEYNVVQGTRPGWDQTAPENSSYTVELEPGQHVNGLVFGNQPQAGSLHGTVWADRNGDGERQQQEHGIPAWPVYLDTNNNGSHDEGERLVHTDQHGHYGFVVEAGQYNVVQGTRPGWQQTAPENGSYSVDVDAGEHLGGLAFGNQPQASSLHGTVWVDRNGDGERQAVERGLPGWPVYLDTNNNGSHEEGERLVHTDQHGHYEFVVEAGQYTVAQGNRPNWNPTAPENSSYTVDVEAAEHINGLVFGNQPQAGSLHGTVWFDRNGNGERGHREPGMRGWIIYLDNNNNASRDEGEPAVRTDPFGHYNFGHLEPGEYVVRELNRHGWGQTSPEAGYHQVVIEPGGIVGDVSFGNRLVHRDAPRTRFTIRISDANGEPIHKLMRGEHFFIDTYVEDLRDVPLGVSSAQLDIVFDDEAVDVSGSLQFEPEFGLERTGVETDGILDDVGAKTDNHQTGSGPVLLARVAFRAMSVGEASFDSIPAHESLTETRLFGEEDSVPTELIDFSGSSVDVVTNPYVNPNRVQDVDNDSYITPRDALILINDLNRHGSRKLPRPGEGEDSAFYVDVNMDGHFSPIDVMWVIDDLNQHGARPVSQPGGGDGEGEGSVFHLGVGIDRLEGPIDVMQMNNFLSSLSGSEAKAGVVSTPWVALSSPSVGTDPDLSVDAVYQLAADVGFSEMLRPTQEIPTGLAEEASDPGTSPFSPDDFWTWDDSIIDELIVEVRDAWSD